MSDLGASASYRGYRIQGLYILSRILEPEPNANSVFVPEGVEDLAIQENNIIREIVQVKSYNGLSLSDLEPAKKGSFFHRAIDYFQQKPRPKISVVNIGPIGPELEKAWSGDEKSRNSITDKLLQHGFNQDQIHNIFENIEIISEDEVNLTSLAFNQLQHLLTGIDPENAFDLIRQWLADCSEARTPISKSDLINKIKAVGQFLADREHHHKEWFTNIQPIEDYPIVEETKELLHEEFFAGASVRYEHILANLDFLRSEKIYTILKGFTKSNVVIIHGASGQGKSALAYRYLYEFYSAQSRFQIQLVENRQHALSTATALSGHASALRLPMVVYLDVSPRDQDWFELVDQLNNHQFIRVLVTIREEDFRRTNIPSHIPFENVFLEFTEREARQIYDRARDSDIKLTHLTFEESWGEFGEEGPLLEYVYFLTQTTTLRQRLEEQAQRIQEEVREKKLAPDELVLLRIVSVITAFEGRVNISSLIGSLDIPEPALTLSYYEKEYLIRLSSEKTVIEALHPIRSQLLADILVDLDVNPWNHLVELGLLHTLEEDWEIFILHSLHKRSDKEEVILNIVDNLSPKTWNGLAGILRCLLWVGVKQYIYSNQSLLSEAHDLMGAAWFYILDLNFIGDDAIDLRGWWNTLGDLIPQEKREIIKAIRDKQTPKDNVFRLAKSWLHKHDTAINPPSSIIEWRNAAESLYWASRLEYSRAFQSQISDGDLSAAFETLPLSVFSDISFALYKCSPDRISKWLDSNDTKVKIRLFEDYRIVSLEREDSTITTHFFSYPEETDKSQDRQEAKNTVHDTTMKCIELIRYLYPQFEKYGSRGYGHQIPGLEIIHDDSNKCGIPIKRLPPKWPVKVNGIAVGILRNQLRPATWEDYTQSLLEIRNKIISSLSFLYDKVAQYFQRDKTRNFLDEPPISTGDWDKLQSLVGDMPLLPLSAVDPWGIGQPESSSIDIIQSESLVPNSILNQIYKPYLETKRNYFSKIQGFLQQALHVSVFNIRAGKLPENSPQRSEIISKFESKGVGLNTPFLSYINLWDAFSSLKQFQIEFRNLFSNVVDEGLLIKLETDELKTLEELFYAWGYFVYKPRTALGNAKTQIPLRHDRQYEEVLKGIREAILKLRSDTLYAQIIDRNVLWEENTALWIQIDMESPLAIYENIEKLIHALRECIGESQYGDVKYFLGETKFKHTVIIPTIQGKSLDSMIWPLLTTQTLMQTHDLEEKQYLYIPHEISMDTLVRLGIDLWRIDEIENIQKLESGFNTLMISLTLLGRSSEMHEFPEELLPTIENYMRDRSSEISEALQMFIDSATVFLDYYNNLSNEEIDSNELLQEAYLELVKFKNNILSEDGILQIAIEDMSEIAKELQELIPVIQGIKLVWLNEVIKTPQ